MIHAHAPPAPQPFVSPRFAHAPHEERARRPLPPLPPLATVNATAGRYSLPGSRNPSPARSTPQSPSQMQSQSQLQLQSPTVLGARPHAPTYPLLTPSGHALSAGGRVRNISTDPTAPCIMYWPDNEPLPERGQIRPSGSAVIQVRVAACLCALWFLLTSHVCVCAVPAHREHREQGRRRKAARRLDLHQMPLPQLAPPQGLPDVLPG